MSQRCSVPDLILALIVAMTLLAHAPLSATGPARPLRPFGAIQPKIVNGTTTAGFPSVALLGLVDADGATGVCTGTLIGCRTVLTAAHCFCQDTPGSLCDPSRTTLSAGFLQHGGLFEASSVVAHPGWDPDTKAHDLAIVELAQPMSGVAPAPINQAGRPPFGSQGVIVGYGVTHGALGDEGIKRWGQVTTTSCFAGDSSIHLCWNFQLPLGPPGEDSNTCYGDSGGPLFVATAEGTTVLAGVTAAGLNLSCQTPSSTVDADVFVDRDWILETADTDLPSPSCGPLPHAGTAHAPIAFGEETLSVFNVQDVWTFDVEPGSQALRVTLNAERPFGVADGGNDFDLLLRRGSPPTNATDALCASQSALALETCEIASPAPGTWYARVVRVAGEGLYQLTATTFLEGRSQPAGPECNGRASRLVLHDRFLVTGEAAFQGNPAPFYLQNICSPEGVSPTALAFYFNPANAPRQEGFLSITNNCTTAQTYKVELASASTRKFTIHVLDTRTGLTATYSNPNPGRSAFFPVDRTTFSRSCLVP